MLVQPVPVFAGSANDLRAAYERAMDAKARLAIYTEELFATGYDAANRAAVKAVRAGDLNLAGLALRDERKTVDKILKGLRLHA